MEDGGGNRDGGGVITCYHVHTTIVAEYINSINPAVPISRVVITCLDTQIQRMICVDQRCRVKERLIDVDVLEVNLQQKACFFRGWEFLSKFSVLSPHELHIV